VGEEVAQVMVIEGVRPADGGLGDRGMRSAPRSLDTWLQSSREPWRWRRHHWEQRCSSAPIRHGIMPLSMARGDGWVWVCRESASDDDWRRRMGESGEAGYRCVYTKRRDAGRVEGDAHARGMIEIRARGRQTAGGDGWRMRNSSRCSRGGGERAEAEAEGEEPLTSGSNISARVFTGGDTQAIRMVRSGSDG
jgi:hypothetical protein